MPNNISNIVTSFKSALIKETDEVLFTSMALPYSF